MRKLSLEIKSPGRDGLNLLHLDKELISITEASEIENVEIKDGRMMGRQMIKSLNFGKDLYIISIQHFRPIETADYLWILAEDSDGKRCSFWGELDAEGNLTKELHKSKWESNITDREVFPITCGQFRGKEHIMDRESKVLDMLYFFVGDYCHFSWWDIKNNELANLRIRMEQFDSKKKKIIDFMEDEYPDIQMTVAGDDRIFTTGKSKIYYSRNWNDDDDEDSYRCLPNEREDVVINTEKIEKTLTIKQSWRVSVTLDPNYSGHEYNLGVLFEWGYDEPPSDVRIAIQRTTNSRFILKWALYGSDGNIDNFDVFKMLDTGSFRAVDKGSKYQYLWTSGSDRKDVFESILNDKKKPYKYYILWVVPFVDGWRWIGRDGESDDANWYMVSSRGADMQNMRKGLGVTGNKYFRPTFQVDREVKKDIVKDQLTVAFKPNQYVEVPEISAFVPHQPLQLSTNIQNSFFIGTNSYPYILYSNDFSNPLAIKLIKCSTFTGKVFPLSVVFHKGTLLFWAEKGLFVCSGVDIQKVPNPFEDEWLDHIKEDFFGEVKPIGDKSYTITGVALKGDVYWSIPIEDGTQSQIYQLTYNGKWFSHKSEEGFIPFVNVNDILYGGLRNTDKKLAVFNSDKGTSYAYNIVYATGDINFGTPLQRKVMDSMVLDIDWHRGEEGRNPPTMKVSYSTNEGGNWTHWFDVELPCKKQTINVTPTKIWQEIRLKFEIPRNREEDNFRFNEIDLIYYESGIRREKLVRYGDSVAPGEPGVPQQPQPQPPSPY